MSYCRFRVMADSTPTLKQRLAIALFVDEERNVGPSISKIARERHLDFFLRDSGSICSDHCLVGDALSYYAMIAACEARRSW